MIDVVILNSPFRLVFGVNIIYSVASVNSTCHWVHNGNLSFIREGALKKTAFYPHKMGITLFFSVKKNINFFFGGGGLNFFCLQPHFFF